MASDPEQPSRPPVDCGLAHGTRPRLVVARRAANSIRVLPPRALDDRTGR
jgi:hypothetical protein